MASVITDPNGRRRIGFTAPDGRRCTIRLGAGVRMDDARHFGSRVEDICSVRRQGTDLSPALAEWVARLPDDVHAKLVACGLVEPRSRARVVTLETMLSQVFSSIRGTVKPSTMIAYGQVRAGLLDHFGPHQPAGAITVAQADGWRQAMVKEDLAKATIHKRIRVARGLFKRATVLEIIDSNPFTQVKAGQSTNDERKHYIDRDTLERVLAACPTAQWRVIFGLGRLAGLRIPSELAGLTWECVDFEAGQMLVKSPKTAGCGKASRRVPIEPRLRQLLLAAFADAPEGSTHVVTNPRHREASANLRTHALRILDRAKVPEWPKLFQNLRGSLATDWAHILPAKACGEFLGHTAAVALTHYHTVRPEDFKLVSGTPDTRAKSDARGAQSDAARSNTDDARNRTGATTRERKTPAIPEFCSATAQPCTSVHGGAVSADQAGKWAQQGSNL